MRLMRVMGNILPISRIPLIHRPLQNACSPRGDYRTLLSFQKAEVIYDITFRFAHKFLSRTDRTID